MSKDKKDKNKDDGAKEKKKEKKLVKEIPSPKPYFNPRADGDGFITFPPGTIKKNKTTSISDIMPPWYDHRDP